MRKIFILSLCLIMTLMSCKHDTKKEKLFKNRDITLAQAKKMIADDNNLVVLDVRKPDEISQGKINGAVELNFYDSDFKTKIEALDKSKNYLVYCRSGNRSGKTIKMMSEMGFDETYNMMGGYTAWTDSDK